MDITPMIDITFLLLIFFLVASRMNTDAPVELPRAHYGTAVPTREAVILTVAQDTPDRALVYKGDGKEADLLVSAGNLQDQEEEIEQYVRGALTGGDPKQFVLIKAERGVKHREVARIARAAAAAGDMEQLYVAVLEVQ